MKNIILTAALTALTFTSFISYAFMSGKVTYSIVDNNTGQQAQQLTWNATFNDFAATKAAQQRKGK